MASILSLPFSLTMLLGRATSASNLYASRDAGTSRNTSGRTSRCLSRMDEHDEQPTTPEITEMSSMNGSQELWSDGLLIEELCDVCSLGNATDFLISAGSVKSICASQLVVKEGW